MLRKKYMRYAALFMAALMLLSCLPMIALASESGVNPFSDVEEGEFYYNAVLWAVNNGITAGHGSSDTFNPDDPCPRSEIVTFMWRANGSPEPVTTENPFTDVKETDYYYKAVLWAVEQGITNGYLDTTLFGSMDTCTRGQVATFLYRAAGKPAPASENNPFTDVIKGEFYYTPVLWAVEQGITNGYLDTTLFGPLDTCTRAQVITFLWRAMRGDILNAADYALDPANTGKQNSTILQSLVDDVSLTGGTIRIPAGEYEFAENGSQRIGTHCIKMKSNVSIIGDGTSTVLKPTGHSTSGMDMFYFNDFLDNLGANYLENCRFEDFVIDAAATSCDEYTSAGKGFMFNLFRNCHWNNVTVRNTDATGFGVDCPIDSSITDCIAEDCGKAATSSSPGASGFGIGFGYSENESLTITNCTSSGNKKFGFFFEHQKRFSPNRYKADGAKGFTVSECEAWENYYNFGGILAMDTVYEDCSSRLATQHGFFFENSMNCKAVDCFSQAEGNTAFVILQSDTDDGKYEVKNITYEQCISNGSQYGAKVVSYGSTQLMTDNTIKYCEFYGPEQASVYTSGTMAGLTLSGNISDVNTTTFSAEIENFVNVGNSWN